ncbi:LCP family protein, partial [Patescibacteria group bacterium]|nr:LCP family protein [Patescibacteria group bacterium]
MEESQPIMSEPVNLLEPKPIYENPKPPRKRGRFLLILLILVVALLFTSNCVYRKYSLGQLPGDSVAYDPVTLKPKKIGFLQIVKNFIFHNNNFLEGQSQDRVNILLLGMGGPGHDGPYLTDTNIIVSIRPSANEVAMTSIPRDLGVTVENQGLRKINFVNSWGEGKESGQGGEYARHFFSKTFSMEIPYYIRVDFAAFQEIIDAVGGVYVDVPRAFSDSQFPGPNESFAPVSFEAGPQTMFGEKALQYARSRHGNNGEGSDFARSKRQQLILMALKERLLSIGTYANPLKIQKIWDSLSNHVSTNLDFGQLMYLASVTREMNGDVKTLVLDNGIDGYLVNYNAPTAGFTLAPRTDNFDEINSAIQNVFVDDWTPSSTPPRLVNTTNASPAIQNPAPPLFPSAKIEIQNGTWQVGLASKMEKKLEENGFAINAIGNAIKRPVTTSSIYLINQNVDTEIVNNLKKILKT